MTGSMPETRMHGRERAIAIAAGTVALASTLLAALVAVALAAGTVTIDSASNSKLHKRVVVSAQGRTLYTLSGESSSRQFCTSAECLKIWPPVRVGSRSTMLKAGSGVHGTLGIISRRGGLLQVTLRGLPLYRYSGDSGKGQDNGEGIEFPRGHVWHALAAASGGAKHTTPTPGANPAPVPVSPTPGY